MIFQCSKNKYNLLLRLYLTKIIKRSQRLGLGPVIKFYAWKLEIGESVLQVEDAPSSGSVIFLERCRM